MLHLFEIHVPIAELVLRGTCIYWFLFMVFRFVIRRDVGALGIADVLLVVIIADAAQNGMAGNYSTISEGIVLMLAIIGWNWLVDWLAFHNETFARFAEPPPLQLIRHGRVLHANLRREMLTIDEVMSKLREQGVAELKEVRHAYLESSGQISVIKVSRH